MAKEERMCVGHAMRWGTFVNGGLCWWDYGGGCCWRGGFCPECLLQMTVVQATLISVIVHNLNEIGQSATEL